MKIIFVCLKLNLNTETNYINTQDFSSFNQNDKSIIDSISKPNTIYALKPNKNKINFKKTIPLLTEFVSEKKDLTLRGFGLKNPKNYNVNY